MRLKILALSALWVLPSSAFALDCETTDTTVICPNPESGAIVCMLRDGVYECEAYYPKRHDGSDPSPDIEVEEEEGRD